MEQGMELDPQILIAVQNERLAAGAIREAQLTAAVQQLTMETMTKQEQLETLAATIEKLTPSEENEDASTEQ